MAVQPRGITKTVDATLRVRVENPSVWYEAIQGDDEYSSTVRRTGELPDTFFGLVETYSSKENHYRRGTHNTGDKLKANDIFTHFTYRPNGFHQWGGVALKSDPPESIMHIKEGGLTIDQLSADPSDPGIGRSIKWMSDGTGSGDAGDIMLKINVGGTVKTITLVDYSTF